MVNRELFLRQIDILSGEYGEYFYRKERVEFIWEVTKYLSDDKLISIINNFIDGSFKAPTRKDFMMAINNNKKPSKLRKIIVFFYRYFNTSKN